MQRNIEEVFLNTVIAFKLMQYSYSLQSFFKNEFKKEDCYIIPFSHILYFKRRVFPLIAVMFARVINNAMATNC